MIKVITYGTYDLLHFGHVRLLQRAKQLGDYLIVGVTADGFDQTRGKINVQQSLIERVEAVRSTGIPDEIIVEEYDGQKIDDICRYDVDIFTVGSDWIGKFDYLNEYCKVMYLPRTEGVSSTEIRQAQNNIKIGLIGNTNFLNKVEAEARFVNGIEISGIFTQNIEAFSNSIKRLPLITTDYEVLLEKVDALYIKEKPESHYSLIKTAMLQNKHILCEAPIALSGTEWEELIEIANQRNLILMDAIKTAYATAYARLHLLIKSGRIGKVMAVDATCTSLKDFSRNDMETLRMMWSPFYEWGPTALLPVFQLLGTAYIEKHTATHFFDDNNAYDAFTKIDFIYPSAVASIKVGSGVKSEGELIISGTKAYIYVPAPWWKTDYFEIRYENPADNKRYFYQLDGEGIRYELVNFLRAIQKGLKQYCIERDVSKAICNEMGAFYRKENLHFI